MSPAARANARWSIETLAELAQESEQLTPLDLRRGYQETCNIDCLFQRPDLQGCWTLK